MLSTSRGPAAFPDFGGAEQAVTAARIADFERKAGKPITWAYFSNNWDHRIEFPGAPPQNSNVGVDSFQPGVDVTAVPALDPPPHGVHVLLRHRLLRKPGGFEGLSPIEIDLPFEDLAVPQLPESADLPAHGDPASCPSPNNSIEGDPAEVLVRLAAECGADVLVVGNRGMHRSVLGSVPNTITHKAPCSVLVVKTT
jgi:nucleotide-binding universal stress UspA family protein